MARTSTPQSAEHAAAKSAPKAASKRRKLDLATAEQADGALAAPRSAYEIAGIQDTHYREKTYAAYEKKLTAMGLDELHDLAYDQAVVGSDSRAETIKRLLDKYLTDNPGQREAVAAQRRADAEGVTSIADRAARILAQGV